MKQKTLYLPDDVHTKLGAVDNASKLVTDLLTKHFEFKDLRNLSIPELERQIKIEERKAQLKKELEEYDG